MATYNPTNPPPPPPLSHATTTNKPAVAFTTPPNYASRLSRLLTLKGYDPLWCPTLGVHATPHTLIPYLSPPNLDAFSALVFTSRAAIDSFSAAAAAFDQPLLSPRGEAFIVAALGKDSELINHDVVSKLCENAKRIRLLVPPVATPSGLVESLGDGLSRRILCPVPLVVGLTEPPVVPDFLRDLEDKGWVPVRVSAYETRWAGADCARRVVERGRELGAVVFTSSAEVEGLLKSLREFGWRDWEEFVRERCPEVVVAAHGPVTAAGAERLGVKVDVVSSRFDSFEGVVDALGLR
ncbi:uncharacterized protein LOC132185573 [Corylus avellana]|uniref:uncharacterized protein LOC132185573 n=1 Tax=Corylus avellana TaxID=13451 RepID=UPI001E236696|nr:uncharacterized protein LOC132185573 [Corylus avellana]